MRVFVCEWVTGGGLCGQTLPPGLCAEGDAMLRALVKDLTALPDVELVTTRDARLDEGPPDCAWEELADPDEVWPAWRRLAAACDAIWPIAPESHGVLERLSLLAAESGRLLLGSSPAAVRLTASKRETAAQLGAAGLPVLPCGSTMAIPESDSGWVVKPDDGAGCESTRVFVTRHELQAWIAADARRWDYVVQPYLPGEAASLSLLCDDGTAQLLSCNRQQVELRDGILRFRGVVVDGLAGDRAACRELVTAVADAIPGLWGYVGVDFIAGKAGPVILEVNPRLTSSYVGLRDVVGVNPAALVLGLLDETPTRGVRGKAYG